MTSRDFAYWLQGFFEISGTNALTMTAEQVAKLLQYMNSRGYTHAYPFF